MKRRVLLLASLWIGCASGDEPATTATATFAPTASASATMGQSTTSASTDSSGADTQTPPGTSGPDGGTATDAGSGTGSSGASAGPSSSGDVPSEQPEDGMYSPCESVVDCIGLTACLTATDSAGQAIDAFCTVGACDSPLAQCDPTPGGTAVPICLPIQTGASTDTLCALDCSQGQECPAGMDCRTLTGSSICS